MVCPIHHHHQKIPARQFQEDEDVVVLSFQCPSSWKSTILFLIKLDLINTSEFFSSIYANPSFPLS